MAKYLYNGTELPALPAWDKTTYPYAFIEKGFSTWLYLAKEPAVYGYIEGEIGELFCGEYMGYRLVDGEWVSQSSGTELTLVIASTIWSNHDIINRIDGSIYLAASKPILLAEAYSAHLYIGTWQKGKFYKRVNNAWVKHQAYRRQNGAWVKVKE